MASIQLSALQTLVLDRLESNSVLFTTAELTGAINECYRIVNVFIGCNQQTVTVSSTANTLIYQTPSPIIFPLYVSFSGAQLNKLSLNALSQNYRGWATDTTAKSGPVREWAPIGITQFVIHPADSIGGRSIAVEGVFDPGLLVNPGDIISIDDEFITMIVELAANRLILKEGGKSFADASVMLQTFYRKLRQYSMFKSFRAPRFFLTTGPPQ